MKKVPVWLWILLPLLVVGLAVVAYLVLRKPAPVAATTSASGGNTGSTLSGLGALLGGAGDVLGDVLPFLVV